MNCLNQLRLLKHTRRSYLVSECISPSFWSNQHLTQLLCVCTHLILTKPIPTHWFLRSTSPVLCLVEGPSAFLYSSLLPAVRRSEIDAYERIIKQSFGLGDWSRKRSELFEELNGVSLFTCLNGAVAQIATSVSQIAIYVNYLNCKGSPSSGKWKCGHFMLRLFHNS